LASPADEHYGAVWSRDAAVACLGAAATGDAALAATSAATLRTLAAGASPLGRVPNVTWPGRGDADWGEAGATDASAWLVIALDHHVAAWGDAGLAEELWPAAVRAVSWLAHQDVTGWGAIDSPAAGDWMDSSLNRSGKVLHVNALFAWALRAGERLADRVGRVGVIEAEPLIRRIDAIFWPRPGTDLGSLVEGAAPDATFPHGLAASGYRDAARPHRAHYLACVSYGRFLDECDVLANVVAVLSGMAGDKAPVILDHLDAAGVARPYPSRTWSHVFAAGGEDRLVDPWADASQDPRWRNPPGAYHNGAIWPFIGGFHAAALAMSGRLEAAGRMLGDVAAANDLGAGFPEWIHGLGGEPGGAPDQTWNAGAYLYADGLVTGTSGDAP
jgi:glycogen debranching enzyme